MSKNRPPPDPHKEALVSLEKKLNLVCDLVGGVAKHYKTGLYLYGRGGMGKSYTVVQHLKRLDVPYQLCNSRMTAKGLFTTLQKAPGAIHVLEDMERLTKDPDAQGVLRSALWAQPSHDRVVTWTTATDGKENFTFSGGLILISNRPLADLPELRALATRIEVHRMDVNEAELAALMREVARQGYRHRDQVGIGPEECLQVTEFLLKECRAAGCPLDLRLQPKAFQSYLQHAADLSFSHWEDLVAASVREATCHFRHEPDAASPEAKKARRRNVIREIIAKESDPNEQVKTYMQRMKASRADFYRRKREVESGEFDEDNDRA
jgi:hypothetical protein